MKQKKESILFEKEPQEHGAQAAAKGPLMRVLSGEALDPPPIWLMRQAGRYLPEYRAVRAKTGSFLELCFNPALATEVTLQPIARFDLDAAILFSDILVVPYALGRNVTFVEGEGPRLDPIDQTGIARLSSDPLPGRLDPVYEAAATVKSRLDNTKSLIGFCGAPWTVATYMVAGHGTRDQAPARMMALGQPDVFQTLIDKLVSVSVDYLVGQFQAGADVVQIFDSWAGVLGESEFDRWCTQPTAEIVRRVRDMVPNARIIGFPKGAGLKIERYVEATEIDAVGIDWTEPLDSVREQVGKHTAIQGNLDPLALLAGGDALDRSVDWILDQLSGRRFVFNLGHGILPQTPIVHVERLVARVRGR